MCEYLAEPVLRTRKNTSDAPVVFLHRTCCSMKLGHRETRAGVAASLRLSFVKQRKIIARAVGSRFIVAAQGCMIAVSVQRPVLADTKLPSACRREAALCLQQCDTDVNHHFLFHGTRPDVVVDRSGSGPRKC